MSYIPEDKMSKIEELKNNWRFDEAIDFANNVLSKDPTNEDVLFQIADLQYIKWDISKAEKPVDFLLKYRRKNDPMSYYIKWVLEMEKTNWKEASKYLKEAVKFSDFSNAEIIRCFWLSQYWFWNRERWVDFLYKAFNINWFDIEIIYNLIEINLLEHDYNKAKEFIEYYDNNYSNLQTFGKDVNFYNEKVKLFKKYIDSL